MAAPHRRLDPDLQGVTPVIGTTAAVADVSLGDRLVPRKKIVIFSERMRLGFGVDLVVDQQARRLVQAGFDVSVVVLHADLARPPRPYRLFVIERDIRLADLGSRRAFEKVVHRYQLESGDIWIMHTPPFYSLAAFGPGPVILYE